MSEGHRAPDRAERVKAHMRAYRSRLKEQGLRPVQIWALDTRSAEVVAELRRQSLSLAGDPAERDVLDWIEDVTDTDGWS